MQVPFRTKKKPRFFENSNLSQEGLFSYLHQSVVKEVRVKKKKGFIIMTVWITHLKILFINKNTSSRVLTHCQLILYYLTIPISKIHSLIFIIFNVYCSRESRWYDSNKQQALPVLVWPFVSKQQWEWVLGWNPDIAMCVRRLGVWNIPNPRLI